MPIDFILQFVLSQQGDHGSDALHFDIRAFISIGLTILVSVVGALLSRSIRQLDGRMESLGIDIRNVNEKMSIERECAVEMRTRIAHLEEEFRRYMAIHSKLVSILSHKFGIKDLES